MFREIWVRIKEWRGAKFQQVLRDLALSDDEEDFPMDPADESDELRKKLEENADFATATSGLVS